MDAGSQHRGACRVDLGRLDPRQLDLAGRNLGSTDGFRRRFLDDFDGRQDARCNFRRRGLGFVPQLSGGGHGRDPRHAGSPFGLHLGRLLLRGLVGHCRRACGNHDHGRRSPGRRFEPGRLRGLRLDGRLGLCLDGLRRAISDGRRNGAGCDHRRNPGLFKRLDAAARLCLRLDGCLCRGLDGLGRAIICRGCSYRPRRNGAGRDHRRNPGLLKRLDGCRCKLLDGGRLSAKLDACGNAARDDLGFQRRLCNSLHGRGIGRVFLRHHGPGSHGRSLDGRRFGFKLPGLRPFAGLGR